MECRNCVYNHNFLHPPNSIGRWPNGWERTGGNGDSSWRRVTDYAIDGSYCLLVENTCDDFCGIRENPPTPVKVGPGEKWQAVVTMRAERPGKARIRVIFFNELGEPVGQKELDFDVAEEMHEYALEYLIPALAAQAIVETGVVGSNSLWIDRVSKTRISGPGNSTIEDKLTELLDQNAIQRLGHKGLAKGEDDFYFVVLLDAETSEPRIQFGRHLTPLEGGKQEIITFRPSEQAEMFFYEIYFQTTGPAVLELVPAQEGRYMRHKLPATEIYLHMTKPIQVLPGEQPLIVKVANPGREPLSYTFRATGLLR